MWETTRAHHYIFELNGKPLRMFIPAMFRTDLNSRPEAAKKLIEKEGEVNLPALFHDANQRSAGGTKNTDLGVRVSLWIPNIDHYRPHQLTRREGDYLYRHIGLYVCKKKKNRWGIRCGFIVIRLFGKKWFGNRKSPSEGRV